MVDFITAALPWVVIGVALAVYIVFMTHKKEKIKSKVSDADAGRDKTAIERESPQSQYKSPDEQGTSSKGQNSSGDEEERGGNYMALGMLVGMCAGFLLGKVIPGWSQSLGMCMGLPFGLLFGSMIQKK